MSNRQYRGHSLSALASALLLAAANTAHAQNTSSTTSNEIIVIGNPLGSREVNSAVSTLSGTRLLLQKSNTLGETLANLPGVSSTWFGPNASRPVIRGMDGDRIRILDNSGASFDASNISPDHNPALDPLVVERIEVLRGPATLLYGGTAIGGVVNIVDGRIPRQARSGFGGAVEVRVGGAEHEGGASALLEQGNGTFSVHADGFARDTSDYRVPASTRVESPVVNSAAEAKGGALGFSVALKDGYIGASHSSYQSLYGTVAEETVKIDMRQNRSAFEASFNNLNDSIAGIFAKYSRSDYQHVELDDGEPATTFKSKGDEFRLEIKHTPLAGFSGVVGLQSERFDFSALGDEAFIPKTNTRNNALFVYEEFVSGRMKYSLGGRIERNQLASDGAGNTGVTRFGTPKKFSFNLQSASLGVEAKLDSAFTVSGSLALAERAPTYYELLADGPHIATAAYEVGQKTLAKEKSTALDLALKWVSGASSARLGVFSQTFRNYIGIRRTGVNRDADGNRAVTDCGDGTSVQSGCVAAVLPEFLYQSLSAHLNGFEAEANWRLVDKPYTLDVEGKADVVRGEDRTHLEPLPRIAPMRLSVGLLWAMGSWSLRGDIQYHAEQDRVSSDDVIGKTAGYAFVNAALTYRIERSDSNATLFLRGTNLTDQKAFNASTFDTIRGLAPLPGRGVKAGVQVRF